MEARNIKKLYYSISQVSELTSLKQYVLRYWETEFPQLNPGKNRAGNRIYRSDDVDIIMQIKSLLYDRKFTIKGAKQYLKKPLKSNTLNKDANKIVNISRNVDIKTLKDLKNGLNDIAKILENFKD